MALEIMAKLGLDGEGFKVGAQQAKKTAKSVKKSVVKDFKKVAKGMAAAFAINAIKNRLTEVAEFASKVAKLSATFGVSTDVVQKWGFAASQSGIDMSIAFDAMRDLGKNTAEALGGVQGKVLAFKALGIDMKEIAGLPVDEVFFRVAKAIQGIPKLGADQFKAIEDLMGGSGHHSIAMFQADFEGLFDKLEEMGGMIDQGDIMKLGALSKKFDAFKKLNQGVFAGMATTIGESFMFMFNMVSAQIDVIAERLVSLGSAAKSALKGDWMSAAESLLKAGMGKKRFDEAQASGGGNWDMFTAGAKGAGSLLLGGEAFDRAKQKGKDTDKLLGLTEGAESIQAQIAGKTKERMEAMKEMEALEADAEKRRFAALTTEQKLVELAAKRAALQQKLNKLGGITSEADIQLMAKKGATTDAEKEALIAKEQAENLEIMRAQKEMAGLDTQISGLKGETATAVPTQTLAGENKFGSLARVGGRIGGSNPVLTTAVKTMKLTEEIKKNSQATAGALGVIAGTQGAP